MKKRVVCLYRVSTKKQLDKKKDPDEKQEDIPMQRRECVAFIEKHEDWELIDEVIEPGVSGYKVPIKNRDKLSRIKEMAKRKEFDVLLVFMFDRLGRRDLETLIYCDELRQCGIEIWTTNEGRIDLDSQAGRIVSFVNLSSAETESKKTSTRVKAKHTQMTQDGIWRGGNCPFGYKLVHNGRIGKKDRLLYDLVIDEETSRIVLEIFDLVTTQGYGTQRIANLMNEKYPNLPNMKYPNQKKIWTRQTVLNMLRNPIYAGRLHMNDIQSEPIEALRLIPDSQFDFVDQVLKSRVTTRYREEREAENEKVPEGTTKTSVFGASLLSGILYCAHCGCKLVGTYCTKTRYGNTYIRPVYRCYNGSIKAKGCTGQTVYSASMIENAVLTDVRQYFATINDAVDVEWRSKARERIRDSAKKRQRTAEDRLAKLQSDEKNLKLEIMKSINGESLFEPETLKEMLDDNKRDQAHAEKEIAVCKDEVSEEEQRILRMTTQYKDIRDWSKKFEMAPLETQKMILARLIERINVGKGAVDGNYDIEIHYHVTAEDFNGDVSASAS